MIYPFLESVQFGMLLVNKKRPIKMKAQLLHLMGYNILQYEENLQKNNEFLELHFTFIHNFNFYMCITIQYIEKHL